MPQRVTSYDTAEPASQPEAMSIYLLESFHPEFIETPWEPYTKKKKKSSK